jgi:hypothetical protein
MIARTLLRGIISVVISLSFFSCIDVEHITLETGEWIHDTDNPEITFVNGNETMNIKVDYEHRISDTASPFIKSETSRLMYKPENSKSQLHIIFFPSDDLAFELWEGKPYEIGLLDSSAVIKTQGGNDLVTEGSSFLQIMDNYSIENTIYERVAVLTSTHPHSFFKDIYYSKKDGLVALKDSDDKFWIRK